MSGLWRQQQAIPPRQKGKTYQKESDRAQILEAKGNLQRMIQEIPMREEERAAVEDGLAALEKLTTKLANAPAPAGPTLSELGARAHSELPILRRTCGSIL